MTTDMNIDLTLVNRALKDLQYCLDQRTSALDRAMIELQEGQSRFMSSVFDTVNTAHMTVMALEKRVQQLEAIVRGMYDTGIARAYSSDTTGSSLARDDGI